MDSMDRVRSNENASSSTSELESFGSRRFKEIQHDESLLSFTEAKDQSRENNAAIILPETNPTKSWKLPKVDPLKIYRELNQFQLIASSVINIKEKAIKTSLNNNKMHDVSLLDEKQISVAKKKYQYVHQISICPSRSGSCRNPASA